MSLRRRTLLGFGTAMVVLIGLMYGLLTQALATHLAQVEGRDIQREVEQVLAVLNDRRGRLDSFAADYAGWDDTYRFVRDLNTAYITSNLPNETFAGLGLNFILYARLDGTLVYGRGYDLTAQRAVPVPTSLRHALVGQASLVGHTSPDSSRTGILALPEGVLLVASRPILTSEKEGPIRGALLMARYLDDQMIRSIAQRAEVSLTAYRTDAASLPADIREARDRLSGSDNLLMRSLSNTLAAGYALLRDVDGNPAMILRVDFPRVYYVHALASLRHSLAIVATLALLGGVCALLALEKWVLSRATRLSTAVEHIGAGGDPSARIPADDGRDELSLLAGSINRMLDSLERSALRQEQSDRRKAAIVEHAHEGICLVDLQTHRIEEANAALREMLGTARERLAGLSVEQVFAGPAVVAWGTHLPPPDGTECAFETRHVRPDGQAVELEISVSLVHESDRQIACAVVRDITERHLAERERARLEEQLRQVQKLQAVGQLAAGMAHNFNNVLAVIMSTLELVMMEADAALSARLEVALNSATKAASMIKQFLVFSRQMPTEKRPVRLHQVIGEVVEMCQRTFDRKIELRVEMRDLPFVLGDQSQIHGVLLNMCINARDALEACDDFGRPLWVDLRADVVRLRGDEVGHPAVASGEYVRVTIADNGSGMDDAIRQRIFEPFFTTKEPGRGTGLGLSTAYGVISEHGGWIDCQSRPGVGTTFEVYLPVAREADVREAVSTRPLGDTLGGTETILIVEDEEDLRRMFANLLENHGYRVLQAFDGQDGVTTFVSQARNIDLVLLDLSMPRMSGWEVMGAMRAVAPNVRIVLCSGYPVDEDGLNGAQAAVSKPFEAAKLLTTIRRVLDQAETRPHADREQAAA